MKVQCAKPKIQIQLVKTNTADNWLGQPVYLNESKQTRTTLRETKNAKCVNQVTLNFDC